MTPNTCITGMCLTTPWTGRSYHEPTPAETETTKNNREVVAYFKLLGYDVQYDSSRRLGVYWHEIIGKDGHAICQIDGGVPLGALRVDMIAWHKGTSIDKNPSGWEYDIRGSIEEPGEMTDEFRLLCQHVFEKEPETQLGLTL